MLEKSDEIKEDLKDFLLESITTLHTTISRKSLKDMSVEALQQALTKGVNVVDASSHFEKGEQNMLRM